MNTNAVKFNAAQRTAAGVIVNQLLAEHQADQFYVPQLKTPIAGLAKAAGFSHREGLAVADRAIAKFAARAERAAAKVQAERAAAKAKAERYADAIAACVKSQRNHLTPMTTDELHALALVAGLRGTKADVARVQRSVLEAQIERCYNQWYRTCVNGDVSATATAHSRAKPAPIGVRQVETKDWDLYRGDFKGWSATILNTRLWVRTDYWSRVAHGCGIHVDCQLILDATPVAGAENLFKATWVKQGRGNQITALRGYLAVAGAIRATGATADEALTRCAKAVKAAAKAA